MSLEIEIPDGYELVGVYTTEEQFGRLFRIYANGWPSGTVLVNYVKADTPARKHRLDR